jgi:hypothetical protein
MLHFRFHPARVVTPAAASREEPCEDVPMLDDAGRRQLRFSLILQGFAILMMGGALVVRMTTFGWDLITGILAAAVVVIVAAAVFTVRRLRAG